VYGNDSEKFQLFPLLSDRKAGQTHKDLTSPEPSLQFGPIHCEC